MKPATVEIRKAIDTLVDFSMFTETGKIRTIAVKALNLFEKELYGSMKQTLILNLSNKKIML